jgi:hypothetical protein
MKLQLHADYPAENWTGAIGAQAFAAERGAVLEVDGEIIGPALLRMTWQKRDAQQVEGQDKPKVTYTNEPVFELASEPEPEASTDQQGAPTVRRRRNSTEA